MEDRFQNKGFCQGGKTNFHVLPNGDLYPCSYGVGETELLLGNVVKGTLLEDNIQRLEKINTSQYISVKDVRYIQHVFVPDVR